MKPHVKIVLGIALGMALGILLSRPTSRPATTDAGTDRRLDALSLQLQDLAAAVDAHPAQPAPTAAASGIDPQTLRSAVADALDAHGRVAVSCQDGEASATEQPRSDDPLEQARHQQLEEDTRSAVRAAIADGRWTVQDRETMRRMIASDLQPDAVVAHMHAVVEAINSGQVEPDFDGPPI